MSSSQKWHCLLYMDRHAIQYLQKSAWPNAESPIFTKFRHKKMAATAMWRRVVFYFIYAETSVFARREPVRRWRPFDTSSRQACKSLNAHTWAKGPHIFISCGARREALNLMQIMICSDGDSNRHERTHGQPRPGVSPNNYTIWYCTVQVQQTPRKKRRGIILSPTSRTSASISTCVWHVSNRVSTQQQARSRPQPQRIEQSLRRSADRLTAFRKSCP